MASYPYSLDSHNTSGIDAAGARLERAFARLERALAQTSANVHSLKADKEKLNHLLNGAEQEIAQLKEVAASVYERLDRTITALEQSEP